MKSVRFVSGMLSRDKAIIKRAFEEYYKKHFSYPAPKKDGCRKFYFHLLQRLVANLVEELEQPITLSEDD